MTSHDRAIEAAKKVIGKLKKIIKINRRYYNNVFSVSSQSYREEELNTPFAFSLNRSYFAQSKRASLNTSEQEEPQV